MNGKQCHGKRHNVKDVKTVNNNTTVKEVIALMNKYDKDAILVDQSGKPTGIITVKDVLIRAVEHGVRTVEHNHRKNGLHKPASHNPRKRNR